MSFPWGTGTSRQLNSNASFAILGAAWGLADVTKVVAAKVVAASVRQTVTGAPQDINITAANENIGLDGWPGMQKTLVVVYQSSDTGINQPMIAIAKEGELLRITATATKGSYNQDGAPSRLNVIAATYGMSNVTDRVRDLVKTSRQQQFNADNATLGDGWPGVRKTCSVVWQWGTSAPIVSTAQEGDTIRIPILERIIPIVGFSMSNTRVNRRDVSSGSGKWSEYTEWTMDDKTWTEGLQKKNTYSGRCTNNITFTYNEGNSTGVLDVRVQHEIVVRYYTAADVPGSPNWRQDWVATLDVPIPVTYNVTTDGNGNWTMKLDPSHTILPDRESDGTLACYVMGYQQHHGFGIGCDASSL